MRVAITDKQLLEMMWERFPEIMGRGTEQPVQQEPVGEGWKLVPVEPTEDMWKAVNKLDDEMAAGSYDGKGCSIEQAWHCFLAAAPQPARHLSGLAVYLDPSDGLKPKRYAPQPAPQRSPLTDEEMYLAIRPLFRTDAFANAALKIGKDEYRAIEAAHGIKENPLPDR